jgi:phenylpyruvate tautomerase PptA (4-oxalocrotonate tautomerase family)
MPIDLVVPRDSLAEGSRATLAGELTESLLEWTDATEVSFIRANVGVYIHELPANAVNAGGNPANVARIDVKVPTIALSTQERRQGFTQAATAIIRNAASPGRAFERVWVIISHATEGGWGIDGRALTTEDLE